MHVRNLAAFALLAGAAGVALAMRRPQSQPAAGEGDVLSDPGGDWGPAAPIFDAAAYVEDSLGGVLMTQQHLSAAGLGALADMEGFSATPYPDFKGYSIGHGHLIRAGESLSYVTPEQAAALLAQDVGDAERAVRTAVSVELSQGQFDALTMLAYNIGASAFRRSTLVRKLNAGDVAGAAAEFPRWNMAGGQVLSALVDRRAREREIFEA